MESGCIACSGADHSHLTCVHVGAALHRWMLQLGPGKDMTLVVDIILRLLMWGWREARFGEGIACLSYTKVGHVIAAGCSSRGRIYFMSAQTGEKILCPVTVDSGLGGVRWVSFSPMGVMIAAGCANGKIYFIDAQSGEVKRALNAHSGWVNAVAWSHCGKWLASGGDDKMVYIYDAQTFEVKCPVNVDSIVLSVAFSPCGKTMAVGCDNGTVVIVDVATVAVMRSLNAHRYALFLFFSTTK